MDTQKTFIIAIGLLLASGESLFANDTITPPAPNPFRDGTGQHLLTPEQIADLRVYAENAKSRLTEALDVAKGKGFAEANTIYLTTIKAVIIDSFKEKERSQLLLRFALNQALELTFGIPSYDGLRVEQAGAMQGFANPELLTVILEDSMQLAMSYFPDDLKAIDAKTLVDLPYAKFAHSRLQLARKWLASTMDLEGAYTLSITALSQWLTTMNQTDNLHNPLFAEELIKVNDTLANEAKPPSPGRQPMEASREALSGKVRVLRGVLRKLDERLSKKTGVATTSQANGPNNIITTTFTTTSNFKSCGDSEINQFLQSMSFLSSPYEVNEKIEAFYEKYKIQLSWSRVQTLINNLNNTTNYLGNDNYSRTHTKDRILVSYSALHRAQTDLSLFIQVIDVISDPYQVNLHIELFFNTNIRSLSWEEVEKLLNTLNNTTNYFGDSTYSKTETKDRIIRVWSSRQ